MARASEISLQAYRRDKRITGAILVFLSALLIGSNFWLIRSGSKQSMSKVPANASQIVSKCLAAQTHPGPPASFHKRSISDRFQTGTKPVFLRNATIWTGRLDGLEVIRGDIFIDKGIIKAVGQVARSLLGSSDISIVDAQVDIVLYNHILFI